MQIQRYDVPTPTGSPARDHGLRTSPQSANTIGAAGRSEDLVSRVASTQVVTAWLETQSEPTVRPDVVAAAREKLSQGSYLTRRAAEQAAAAMTSSE